MLLSKLKSICVLQIDIVFCAENSIKMTKILVISIPFFSVVDVRRSEVMKVFDVLASNLRTFFFVFDLLCIIYV